MTLQGNLQSQSGVDLHWHTPDEYKKLSREQKNELYEWHSTKKGKYIVMKQKASSGYKAKPNSIKKRLQARISFLEVVLKDARKSKN